MRMKLTDAALKRIKPPTHGRTEIWDQTLRGFGVRITEKGVKSFFIMYRIGRKQKRFTVGNYPALSLAEARKQAGKLMQTVDEGNDPGAEKEARRDRPDPDTVAEAIDEFIKKHVTKKKPRTQEEMKRPLVQIIKTKWGKRPLASVTRREIISLLDDIHDERGPYAANRTLAVVRKFFNWCVDEEFIDGSPCVRIKKPGDEKPRERYLNEGEIKSVWNACDQVGFPFGDMTKMLLTTAQRRNEVAQMEWSEIDLEKKIWTIPQEKTKGDRAHQVPLSSIALEILEALPRFDGSYVFTTTSGAKPVSGFSVAKKRTDEFAGVTGWRLHDLRRTVGTSIAELGIAPATISRILNHKEGGVTAIYNRHSYLEEKRHALDVWASKLGSIIKPSADAKVVPIRG